MVSTLLFPLRTAYKNDFLDTRAYAFTVTGTVTTLGITGSVTGNGGFNQSAVSASTFEATAGSQKTKTLNGSITVSANGSSASQVLPTSSQSTFVDAAYTFLGYTSTGSYNVPAAPVNIPATAKVGDSGTAGTFTNYTSSAKITQQGSNVFSWSLTADTVSTAILNLTQTLASATGLPAGTLVDSFRVTADGSVTRIKTVSSLVGASNGTLTYLY